MAIDIPLRSERTLSVISFSFLSSRTRSAKKESFDFLMDEGVIDTVSFLLDGRRSSTAPYWHPNSIKTMPRHRVEAYVNQIINVFEREVS